MSVKIVVCPFFLVDGSQWHVDDERQLRGFICHSFDIGEVPQWVGT